MSDAVREKWAGGKVALDCWVSGASLPVAEAIGRLPVDSVTIDLQHAPIGFEHVPAALMALNDSHAAAFVRVPGNDSTIVQRVLDAGADGVMCPMINTALEAERFARACRYPPAGERSFGPYREADPAAYFERFNDEVVVIAQIETIEAVANAPAIAATSGIDLLYVGSNDLSVSAGEGPIADFSDERTADRHRAVVEAAHASGRRAGMLALSAEAVEAATAWGMDFVSVGIESMLAVAAARQAVERALATVAR